MKRLTALLLSLTLLFTLVPSAFAAPEEAAKSTEASAGTPPLDPTQAGPVVLAIQLCKYTVDTAVQSTNDAQANPAITQTAAAPQFDSTDFTILASTVILTMISITHEIVFH